MVLEQSLLARDHLPAVAVSLSLSLDEAISLSAAAAKDRLEGAPVPPPGSIDANVLRRLAGTLNAPVLWVELPAGVADGGALPAVYGLSAGESEHLDALVHDECRKHLDTLPKF